MSDEKNLCCPRKECAGNRNCRCHILTDTRFKTSAGTIRPCPFFKTREQAEKDRRRAELNFFKKHGYYYTPETQESEEQQAILTKKKKYRSRKNGKRSLLLQTKAN